MSLLAEQIAFNKDKLKLEEYILSKGYDFVTKEVQRTPEQQAIYARTGRSKTSNSMHLECLAADILIFREGRWLQDKEELQDFGNFWESLSPQNQWGGNWKSLVDCPHFERRKA